MYPKVDNNTYPAPATVQLASGQVEAIGFPANSTDQFYPPPTNSVFQTQSQGPAPWSTSLCDCCDDVGNCCITCLCPCITFGQIAEIIDRGSTSCGTSGALYTLILCLTGCQCIYSCFYRSKLRGLYSLHESPCNDCLVHCCCEACALCQEYRELKRRGFDMHIGWHANMERQGRTGQPEMAPPTVQSAMSR